VALDAYGVNGYHDRIRAVLTAGQQARWAEMICSPFNRDFGPGDGGRLGPIPEKRRPDGP
jgi:hypothetical protein